MLKSHFKKYNILQFKDYIKAQFLVIPAQKHAHSYNSSKFILFKDQESNRCIVLHLRSWYSTNSVLIMCLLAWKLNIFYRKITKFAYMLYLGSPQRKDNSFLSYCNTSRRVNMFVASYGRTLVTCLLSKFLFCLQNCSLFLLLLSKLN